MKIMGIDLGDSTTGISVCDDNQILASPLCIIEEKNRKKLCKKIHSLCLENSINLIVLGNPINMNGTSGKRSMIVKEFQNQLFQITKIRIILRDERLSTVFAKRCFLSANVSSRKYKKRIDAASACLILQNYLDSLKNNGFYAVK